MRAEDRLARFELAAAAVALVLLFALIPHAITGDGLVRYDSLNTLLTKGELPEQRYSYVGPLAAAPIWLQNARTQRAWWAERFNVILLAAAAAAAWHLLRGAVSPAVRSSFVLILIAAGMMPSHVRNFYGERTVMPFSGRSGFSYPLLPGVLSLLFSFGKGLVFFAPGLAFVAQARRLADRPVAELLDAWMLFLAGLLLVYARWWAWYGGWYWGPRLLLIAVYPSALARGNTAAAETATARHLFESL